MELTRDIDQRSTEHDQLIKRSGWSQSSPALYTADDLIDAYEEGKRKADQEVTHALREHLFRAMDEAERFYLDIRAEHGMVPAQAHLRVLSWCPFAAEALYLVKVEEFISDEILGVYDDASERSDELRCEKDDERDCFDLAFRFMPHKEETNTLAIYSDFSFRYERQEKQAQT